MSTFCLAGDGWHIVGRSPRFAPSLFFFEKKKKTFYFFEKKNFLIFNFFIFLKVTKRKTPADMDSSENVEVLRGSSHCRGSS